VKSYSNPTCRALKISQGMRDDDLRTVDKALFAYGSLDKSLFRDKATGAGASQF